MKKLLYLLLLLPLSSCDFQDDPTIPASIWEIAVPSEVGADEALLLAMHDGINSASYGQINSVTVVKDDKLIYQNFYNENPQAEVDILGSTVSVASILLGIAIDQNIIPSLDTPIRELLFDQSPFNNELRAQITVRNLVGMTAGIAWNEFLRPFDDPRNTANQMSQTPDWANYTLGVEMEAVPGGRFAYSSGTMMVLSKIIEQQAGMSLATFAQTNLFEPMDINATWTSDPSGVTNAGWGLSMTSTDLAKIGYLALKEGDWFGTRIVSSDYIEEMSSQSTLFNFTNSYGLGWWRFSDELLLVENSEVNDIYFTWGAGGQFVFVVPHLDMIVATTASNFGPDLSSQSAFFMLFEEIIPAMQSNLAQ